jgi:hypothetical protein
MTLMVAAVIALAGTAMADNTVHVETYAALNGTNYGLSVDIDGSTNNAYVEDQTPEAETTYRAAFWLDPNSLSMANWDRFAAFLMKGPGNLNVGRLQLQWAGGNYRLRFSCLNNGSTWKFARLNGTGQKALPIGDNPVQVVLETVWLGSNQGYCGMTVGGVEHWNGGYQSGNNPIDKVRLGATKNMGAVTALGEFYVDEFESFRTLAP